MRLSWHPFAELFPLLEGDDRDALLESVRSTRGIDEQPILFRVVKGRPQGLDGRNRESVCRELKIRPRMLRVRVPDDEVKDFILRRNVHRRHMTPAVRAAIIADLRAGGESVRQIADVLGVSKSTVHRAAEAVPDGTPETVTGRDGKTYPATLRLAPKAAGPQPFGLLRAHRHFAGLMAEVDAMAHHHQVSAYAEAPQEVRRLLGSAFERLVAWHQTLAADPGALARRRG